MMSVLLTEKIQGPSAWVAEDFKDDHTWLYELTDAAIETLDSALRSALAFELPIEQLTMMDPGDVQFANNNAVLHSRTGFEDFEDEQLRRK